MLETAARKAETWFAETWFFEVICRYSVKQGDAKSACANFKNPIKIPRVGSHVAITGTWVQDSEHEKGFEIHPVSSIVIKK